MRYNDLTSALGYDESLLFCEREDAEFIAPSNRHWLRSARESGVKGSYYFRVSPAPGSVHPAVHIAEAETLDEARLIHRQLWNQGLNPFLIILLPGEIRVFTGFAYDPEHPAVGQVGGAIDTSQTLQEVTWALRSFTAHAIDNGEIWRKNSDHLGSERRVDTTLLSNLLELSHILSRDFSLSRAASHSLIGKFVYLSYLRSRDILSDRWMEKEAGLSGSAVFAGEVFSADITLRDFRKLADSVEERFNGKLFPIPWGSQGAPTDEAVRTVARIFAGEDALTGQGHLSFKAYDFASVPVEFLSSIYEQFLHSDDEEGESKDASDPEKQGAHYTPEPLADYLVSEVDRVLPLTTGVRILDPCCGSGVFLVMAYRRLIELECHKRGCDSLHASELKKILVNSIFGVERNLTACQISSFSLILAMLSHVDPPELHRRHNFRFPDLIGSNIFHQDFFCETGPFWKKAAGTEGGDFRFDWILGNPPWVELDKSDPDSAALLDWSEKHREDYGLARARTGEAFAWKVLDCLAEGGAAGLILHGKSLTNDHLASWRKRFFGNVRVKRLTNLSNLAYIIFPSAQQPAMTLTYQNGTKPLPTDQILHMGPFVANQNVLTPKRGNKRRSWAIGYTESEIKHVSQCDASEGDARVWKQALWGNHRDMLAIGRLQRAFGTTLGEIANENDWTIALGLQLRDTPGSRRDPNEEPFDEKGENLLEGKKVLSHRAFVASGGSLQIEDRFLQRNEDGCFIRKRGGTSGLALISGPRLFLWNNFAAYTEDPFVIKHDKLGLVGGSSEEMKAVAALWNTSFVSYLLFFVTSAAWGIGYTQIDKGDVTKLPFPKWNSDQTKQLAGIWEAAQELEQRGGTFADVKIFIDGKVAGLLGIPDWVVMVVQEFFAVRYQCNKGKIPAALRKQPDDTALRAYAETLQQELDRFVGRKVRHHIRVLASRKGISVSVTVTKDKRTIAPEIVQAAGNETYELDELLRAAESKVSQWFYVKRSVRLFDGDTIHLIKPPQFMEWTRTRALLDADDLLSEAIDERRQTSS